MKLFLKQTMNMKTTLGKKCISKKRKRSNNKVTVETVRNKKKQSLYSRKKPSRDVLSERTYPRGILFLPNELLMKIFDLLDITGLFYARRICKIINTVSQSLICRREESILKDIDEITSYGKNKILDGDTILNSKVYFSLTRKILKRFKYTLRDFGKNAYDIDYLFGLFNEKAILDIEGRCIRTLITKMIERYRLRANMSVISDVNTTSTENLMLKNFIRRMEHFFSERIILTDLLKIKYFLMFNVKDKKLRILFKYSKKYITKPVYILAPLFFSDEMLITLDGNMSKQLQNNMVELSFYRCCLFPEKEIFNLSSYYRLLTTTYNRDFNVIKHRSILNLFVLDMLYSGINKNHLYVLLVKNIKEICDKEDLLYTYCKCNIDTFNRYELCDICDKACLVLKSLNNTSKMENTVKYLFNKIFLTLSIKVLEG